MRLAIHLQREVARLHHYAPAQSNRQIGRALGLSPNTVAAMRTRLRACPLRWDKLSQLDDDAWRATLVTHDHSIAQRKASPDWEWVHSEMQRPDATREQLWREWREVCPQGIGYTQFSEGYRNYCRGRHIVMRRIHVPGDKLFVDYAGRTVEVRDPNGPSFQAQIFVAVLGYSNLTFLWATASQNTADWVVAHVRCFEALGGVSQWVVSDNLKAAVLRRDKGRVVINPAYRDCLRHYDTAPLPTGVRKPKHKAKAEVGVQIAQRWVLFRLRDRVFFSLDELNVELQALCTKLNSHRFKKLPTCRQERFEAGERAALKPLPDKPYELCDWRYGVRVPDDYHVEHLRCFYSVPYSLIGESVDLRFTATAIEIFVRGRRVAIHALLKTPGEASTLLEHRPVAHQRILEGEPKKLMSWAGAAGPKTQQMIRHHLQDRSNATNGLVAARRMRELARLHGDKRFEEVCAYALALNITALRSVQSILKTGADRRPRESGSSARPAHDNVRGADYFGERT